MRVLFSVLVALAVTLGSPGARAEAPPADRTVADVRAAAVPADWRSLDPENTLYVELEAGRVVIARTLTGRCAALQHSGRRTERNPDCHKGLCEAI